jgi:hypothetical protein
MCINNIKNYLIYFRKREKRYLKGLLFNFDVFKIPKSISDFHFWTFIFVHFLKIENNVGISKYVRP